MKPVRRINPIAPTFDNLNAALENHGRALAGNIEFGVTNGDPAKNIRNWRATGTTPGVANTDFTITHALGYVPDTILMQDTDNGGVIYRSPATAWTKTTVTLRCTTVSANYKVRVV